jgi:hypothetical protein
MSFWNEEFKGWNGLVSLICSMLIAILFSGTAKGSKAFFRLFNIVEIVICIFGGICFLQYCFNLMLTPFLTIDVFRQNIWELVMWGQEYKTSGVNTQDDIFLFASIFITFSGFVLQEKKVHLFFTVLFLLLYFIIV